MPVTIHHHNLLSENMHSATFEDESASENFYNYIPNGEYDGGFFYGEANNGLAHPNGVPLGMDTSLLQTRSQPL